MAAEDRLQEEGLAYAKVNLTLDVLGRRPDGYHEVRMVMVPLALADLVQVQVAEGLAVETDNPAIPAGAGNLAHQAAVLLRKAAGVQAGAHIRIAKHIPVAAGLGGGSADAAAVLHLLNVVWGLGWPMAPLMQLGARLGADVPFCLLNRLALAEGIGERLTPLPPAPALDVVVATPRVTWPGPKTATVYRAYRPDAALRRPGTEMMLAALAAGDVCGVAQEMANVLEPAATALNPVIGSLKAAMLRAGAPGAVMAGAGPSVVAVCASAGAAGPVATAAREFTDQVFVTRTLSRAGH